MNLLTQACNSDTCPSGISVNVDGATGSLRLAPNGHGVIENGAKSPKLYIRKISSNYYGIDIYPGIRIIFSLSGMVQLSALSSLYKGQVNCLFLKCMFNLHWLLKLLIAFVFQLYNTVVLCFFLKFICDIISNLNILSRATHSSYLLCSEYPWMLYNALKKIQFTQCI